MYPIQPDASIPGPDFPKATISIGEKKNDFSSLLSVKPMMQQTTRENAPMAYDLRVIGSEYALFSDGISNALLLDAVIPDSLNAFEFKPFLFLSECENGGIWMRSRFLFFAPSVPCGLHLGPSQNRGLGSCSNNEG